MIEHLLRWHPPQRHWRQPLYQEQTNFHTLLLLRIQWQWHWHHLLLPLHQEPVLLLLRHWRQIQEQLLLFRWLLLLHLERSRFHRKQLKQNQWPMLLGLLFLLLNQLQWNSPRLQWH